MLDLWRLLLANDEFDELFRSEYPHWCNDETKQKIRESIHNYAAAPYKTGSDTSQSTSPDQDHISLTMTLPKLPAEAQSWIKGMPPKWRGALERKLNIVGEESFLKNWKHHKAEWEKLAYDFDL
jgi:hypothetical protein